MLAPRQLAVHLKNPIARHEIRTRMAPVHFAVQRERDRPVDGAEPELGHMVIVIEPAALKPP